MTVAVQVKCQYVRKDTLLGRERLVNKRDAIYKG